MSRYCMACTPLRGSLRRLTSLEVTIDEQNDEFEELVEDVPLSHLPWVSDQVAQLPALRALCIQYDGDSLLAVLQTLAALSAVTSLRRLKLTRADLAGADWGAAPFCALTALCLCSCHAPHAMAALAPRTQLLRLRLSNDQLVPGDVSTFVQQLGRALAGAPAPSLDLDLSSEYQVVTDFVLEELLGAAERLGLRHLRVPLKTIRGATRGESAVGAVAAFNKRWRRQRKCVCGYQRTAIARDACCVQQQR